MSTTGCEKNPLHLSNFALRTLATSNTLTLSPSRTCQSDSVNSPMTNLVLNLSGLSTGRGTPRRKLSLSGVDTPNTSGNPTPDHSDSTESGCFVDSPTPIDSPTLELSAQRFHKACRPDVPPEAFSKRKTIAFRRFNSLPVPMMRLSPVEIDRENYVQQALPCAATSIEDANESMDTSCDTLIVTDSHKDRGPLKDDEILLGHSPPMKHFTSEDAFSQPKKHMLFFDETSSQDSGVSCDREKDPDHFAAPIGVPRRKSKLMGEDTCSPFKYSPVKDIATSPSKRPRSASVGCLNMSNQMYKEEHESDAIRQAHSALAMLNEEFVDFMIIQQNLGKQVKDFSGKVARPVDAGSPLKKSRLTSLEEDVDDGFLDIMDEEMAIDEEVAKINTSLSGTMSNLLNAPVLNKDGHTIAEDEDTPVIRRTKSCKSFLTGSPTFEKDFCLRSRDFSYKRDQPQDESTPLQSKKRKRPESVGFEFSTEHSVAKPQLHRCHSESEAMIKSAVNRFADEPDLLGDCSKPYCLPTIPGKHQDLKSISCDTLCGLLQGAYRHEIEKFLIIDCRYPYEYRGGHIQCAENIYTKEDIIERFLRKPITAADEGKRVVMIFHCEFSSERGPNLLRFLRNRDRNANKDNYPALFYPELYLLEGGYKVFYEMQKEFCDPQSYTPMLHRDYADDLKHFRAKSKSWAGEKGEKGARPGFRPLKF